jgi:hypothetical protein
MHALSVQFARSRRAPARSLLVDSIKRMVAAAREMLGLVVVAASVGGYVVVLSWVAGLAGGA